MHFWRGQQKRRGEEDCGRGSLLSREDEEEETDKDDDDDVVVSLCVVLSGSLALIPAGKWPHRPVAKRVWSSK